MDQRTLTEIIEREQIEWVQTHFTDLFGRLRVLHIPAKRFLSDDIVSHGIGFDGSSVGFTGVEKSDLIVIPDLSTFLPLPHEEHEARVIAGIHTTSREPHPVDPRFVLKQALHHAKEQGFDSVRISPEMEFFALKPRTEDSYEIKDNEGYFFPPPLDDAKHYRKELSDHLLASGYQVKYHHHENGKYQHEIEISSLEAQDAADFCVFFKYLARELACREGMQVTFMPKPSSLEAGNGMHAHISLYDHGNNMFADIEDEYGLSQTARYFIGGIMDHAQALAAFTNPTINSYKRLIPHYEAPIYIAWGQHNRSSLIRIPAKKTIDIEIRNGDPAANPYLFFASVLYAGLDGMQKKQSYDPVESNIYDMTAAELAAHHIQKLPSSLYEALEAFESDDVLQHSLGRELSELYIRKKKEEYQQYMAEITDLDYEFYFNC